MDFIDYRKKLGLNFSDEEKVKNFLAKAFCAFSESIQIDNELPNNAFNNFCFNAGIKAQLVYCNEYVDSPMVYSFLQQQTEKLNSFLYYYSVFISSFEYKSKAQESWINALNYWAKLSNFKIEIIEDDKNFFIFPKGAEELDDALVSEPLEWLNEYPKTRTEFVQALKDYSDLNDDNASDVADKFRKALERFFQEFFGKNGTLENLKKEYGTYMKGKGVPSELSNNLETLLQAYTNFINGYAKHHSKTNKNLLEYILYQTGNIVRLMITLKKEEN